jgi:Signal transduction histidine kinase
MPALMRPEPHRMQDELKAALGEAAGAPDREAAPEPAAQSPAPPAVPAASPSRVLGLAAAALTASAAAIAFGEPAILAFAGAAFGSLALLDLAWRRLPAPAAKAAKDAHDEAALDRSWERGEGAGQTAALFDALGDMFVTTTPDGRILHANGTFRAVTGCADPEGRSLGEVGIAPHLTANGLELEFGEGDGARIWTWHQAAARDPVTGEFRVHGVGRDVTADRQAGAALEAARAKAEAASRAKTRFLATVSHEIRTPLNGILGMTHLLGQTRVTPEQASYLKTVRESGHALMSLIEDLLDATSIEAGRFHLRRTECNPHELVQGICELMAAHAHEKGIEIATHVAPDVPYEFVSDPGRLRQVLFNLIGNAIKFTAEGGILVEVRRKGEQLEFSVTDTGPGLKQQDIGRIFEEFERADNSATRRHGGAGLGLSISSRIVATLGGEIGAESELGKGSRFHFTVPLECAVTTGATETVAQPLAGKVALVLAPQGPVATALVRSITELGGTAAHAAAIDELDAALASLAASGDVSDILIDRRIAASDPGLNEAASARVGAAERTLVIAPEDSRDLSVSPDPAANKWLVRPVRMRSLVSVLTARDDRADRNRASGGVTTPTLIRPSDAPTYDILLAEDNPVNALVVRTMLAREGHRVTLVENGIALVDEALERPDGKARFDLVITDVSMPDLDGGAAIEKIRAAETAEGFQRLPILVLSADGQAAHRDELLANGADGHAEKPIDPAWLASLVAMTAKAGRAARA